MKPFRNFAHQAEQAIDKTRTKIKEKLDLFDPVIIFPYLGYSNGKIAYVSGRILEKEQVVHEVEELENNLWDNLHRTWKRYESDEIPRVGVEGELAGRKTSTVSSEEGYFTLIFEDIEDLQLKDGWHEVQLRIAHMPFDLEYEEEASVEVIVCNQQNEFGIISDVDDTIMESNATSFLKKMRTMLSNTARTRVVFEGVDKLYHNLCKDHYNPIFFVSGSSYNLYDKLIKFCEYNDIPKGPFFLRDIGLNAKQWIKQDTRPYKLDYIDEIMTTFDQLDFICIGDSGQQDPEIYREAHEKYPGRIKAIYIRHVYTDERQKELEGMASEMDIPLLVMEHSGDALEHAKEQGWV